MSISIQALTFAKEEKNRIKCHRTSPRQNMKPKILLE